MQAYISSPSFQGPGLRLRCPMLLVLVMQLRFCCKYGYSFSEAMWAVRSVQGTAQRYIFASAYQRVVRRALTRLFKVSVANIEF